MKFKKEITLSLLIILFSFSVQAKMFKCTDSKGTVSYGSSPCQGDQKENVIQKPYGNDKSRLEQAGIVSDRKPTKIVSDGRTTNPVPNNVCNCKGYAGKGGPCYAGAGGPVYAGQGGPAYAGKGGPCYAGAGGPQYAGQGGPGYAGKGGPRYAGQGGPEYAGQGGPAYAGKGGPCYAGAGGPCYSGQGGLGSNCPSICK